MTDTNFKAGDRVRLTLNAQYQDILPLSTGTVTSVGYSVLGVLWDSTSQIEHVYKEDVELLETTIINNYEIF